MCIQFAIQYGKVSHKWLRLIFILIFLTPLTSFSQDYEEHDIEEFYKKIQLESGTLDEDGDELDFIFVVTTLDEGQYEIEITDGPGDLYLIKGTDYYIKFKFFYGFAGYGEEGILEVGSSAWFSTFYKRE